MEWKSWIGKNIFIKLRSGEVYNGKIINTDNNFIEIMTIYDEHLIISSTEIIKIVDETNKIKRSEINE